MTGRRVPFRALILSRRGLAIAFGLTTLIAAAVCGTVANAQVRSANESALGNLSRLIATWGNPETARLLNAKLRDNHRQAVRDLILTDFLLLRETTLTILVLGVAGRLGLLTWREIWPDFDSTWIRWVDFR